jgi:hypothetical protein
MERALRVLNEMEQAGVLERYAIGGAMAAVFYGEAVLTYDLDVFAILRPTEGGLLGLAPLYDHVRARGYSEQDECVLIEGIPVQFLPAFNALTEEALAQAREADYAGTPTRVLRAEHLVAIAVQTGRAKDRERCRMLMGGGHVDETRLRDVLQRHGLLARWEEWDPSLLR